MGKTKKGDGEKAATTKGSDSLATKKAARRAQAERDRAAALKEKGHTPRRETLASHRCDKCDRPSALVRNGESDKCARCSRAKKVAAPAARAKENPGAFITPDAAAILRQAVVA